MVKKKNKKGPEPWEQAMISREALTKWKGSRIVKRKIFKKPKKKRNDRSRPIMFP